MTRGNPPLLRPRPALRLRAPAAALLLGALAWAAPARAQEGGAGEPVFVGGEAERYLRALQVAGKVPLHPWSIRSFSPRETERLAPPDSGHPWAGRFGRAQAEDADAPVAGLRFGVIAPETRLVYNSAFPYATNDGAVWAGKGATASVRAGFWARFGPLSLVVAPEAFQAQNAEFELAPVPDSALSRFGDWRRPTNIDYPQRFGDSGYGRIDPGQSTLRLDVRGVAAGVSTADQWWGPASEHPLILGNAAPGFLHAFAGTSRPVDLWVAKVHGRVVYGRIHETAYSPADDTAGVRFMAGAVGVLTPRGIPGLEVGAARFFHTDWPAEGLELSDLLKPFEGILKESVSPEDPLGGDPLQSGDNQIASVFFRFTAPRGGLEAYGEYAREDHSFDLRDLLVEPDHQAGYMLGFRKVWTPSERRMVSLRGELLNTGASHLVLARGGQFPFYQHSYTRQGHTSRGQLLGSRAGYGGGASIVAVDLYRPAGRWSVSWMREERGTRGFGRQVSDSTAVVDVFHALSAEGLLRVGRMDVTAGVTGVYEMNRYFRREDVFNLNLTLGARWAP